VNFTSAAGILPRDFPLNAATTINPWLRLYFREHIHGSFGILPRDFQGIDFRTANLAAAGDETDRLLVQTNADFFFLKSPIRDTGVNKNLVVDFKDAGDGTTLIAYGQKQFNPSSPSDVDNQLVEFIVSDAPPYFFIANRQTGTVIDIRDPAGASPRVLIAADRRTPGTDSQLWKQTQGRGRDHDRESANWRPETGRSAHRISEGRGAGQ
jgi:hypothetical protein